VIRFSDSTIKKAEIHWYEAFGIGKKGIQNQNGSSNEAVGRGGNAGPQFAVCVDNRRHPASLELRKIYRLVPDSEARSQRQVRIIDESGEDYLYPQKYFVAIELSATLERVLLRAS